MKFQDVRQRKKQQDPEDVANCPDRQESEKLLRVSGRARYGMYQTSHLLLQYPE